MTTSFSSPGEASRQGDIPAGSVAPATRFWYAVCTMPRHEKSVARHLALRGVEYFLPCSSSQHRWKNGLLATVESPLFPGYVFVRIDTRQRVVILGIDGVYSILTGVGKAPAPLPDMEMEALRAGLHHRRPEPHSLLCVGQRVRIRSGALSGLQGVVIRRKNDLRLVLTLEQIRQSISVEVAGHELEPAAECLAPSSQ